MNHRIDLQPDDRRYGGDTMLFNGNEVSKISRDIAAFQANPKNKYFNELRQDMSMLVVFIKNTV